MRHSVIILLLWTAFHSNIFAQNHEDCIDARELVTDGIPISLADLPDITVDSVIGSGFEAAEWFTDNENFCGSERTFSAQPNDKSYWFAFSAETTGTLELLITPEAPGTTYDFALWRGGCPSDVCSELFYCNWGGNVNCGTYLPTGGSLDPQTNFGYDPLADNNPFVYAEAIQLEAGENYYLLVQNTDEASNLLCPTQGDSLGFTIQFDGNASINTPIIDFPPIALFPLPQTDTLKLCQGTSQTFAVTTTPRAKTYDWISQSTVPNTTITPNALGDSATVTFNGSGTGQICMDMICPVPSRICWNVAIDNTPELEALPFPQVACQPVDLNDRFRDNNNVSGALNFYASAADVINEINPLASSIVTTEDDYWVRSTTPNGCTDLLQMTVLLNYIDVSLVDTFRFCPNKVGRNFVDVNADIVPLVSVNNAQSNDIYRFFADSASAVNNGAPVPGGTLFQEGTYWIKVERSGQNPGDCFGLTSFELLIDNAPDIAPIPDQSFCSSECLQLATFPLFQPNGQSLTDVNLSFFTDSLAAENNDNTVIQTTEICTGGRYWVRAASSAACYDIAPFNLTFFPAPDIIDDTLAIDCSAGCLDLTDFVWTDRNGINQSSLQNNYFDNPTSAEDPAATPLADLVFCSPTQIWLRMTNADNGCFDVAQITIEGPPLPAATFGSSNTICAGDTTNLEITFTGDGPFVFSYTDGTDIFSETVPTTIFRTSVSPDTTATYELLSLMDSNGCTGTATNNTTISVNSSPIIGAISGNCTPSALEYQISFDILGNDTYTVTGIAGNLSGNTFESEFIPSGSSYAFQVAGTNGCPDAIQAPTVFSCECSSVVGMMDLLPKDICVREPAIANYLGSGFSLEKDDILIYVLHEGADTLLNNPLIVSDDPVFVFDESIMQTGVVYYMSAVVTKLDNTNQPIIEAARNPCMDVAQGQPVTFYGIPTVNLSLGSTTICAGTSTDLTFDIDGVGPFDLVYFDGTTQVALSNVDSGHTVTISPLNDTDVYVTSIRQRGVANCDDAFMPADTRLSISVNEAPTFSGVTPQCNDAGNRLILIFELTGGDPTSYTVSGITGSFKGNEFISDSLEHGTPYSVSVMDGNNCPTDLATGVAECFCTADISVAINTVQAVSCAGEQDGILQAIPQNGLAPYTYFWSTGTTDATANNMAPSVTHSVTMTDANGCEVTDTLTLAAPTSVIASTNTLPPSCYAAKDGVVLIIQAQGGTGNYTYSFDGGVFQSEGIRDNFGAGIYEVAVQDENGCIWSDMVTLQDPPQFDVSLGDNITLDLGDSITLRALVNEPTNTVTFDWTSEDPSICADCPAPTIQPINSERYSVTATNSAGCAASASVLVQVQNQRRVFMPSVFSPNGDGKNDLLRPFSGSEVADIGMFRIFNRWGELIYERENMDMQLNTEGWDGATETGQKAPPGVYLFYAEVAWKNGSTDVLTGDVTLIR
ncbi:MAG: gliding motility-associated C-terminal domain-containing protein [Bacteroidota bacterium]